MNKIVVTGANGQLGNCLRDIDKAHTFADYEFVFTDLAELNITDAQAVQAFLTAQKPQWVVNAAAYTAVDKAEAEPEKARLLNATAVGILAHAAANVGAGFVQISTDYVFDGSSMAPLTEDMPTNPQSVYGVTKLEGEQIAQKENNRTIILRTSWLYSAYGHNFVGTMRDLGAKRSEVGVVADQWGSPTLADDLALAIMIAIVKADTGAQVYGLYHFSNEGTTCWADFAQQIMDFSGLQCTVKHLTTAEYPTAARRPASSVMSKHLFSTTFDAVIPDWEASLEKLIARLDK
ncbi:MAG: dTDP-4-dehydrorhamnose reductase [Mucinivorans sp.]